MNASEATPDQSVTLSFRGLAIAATLFALLPILDRMQDPLWVDEATTLFVVKDGLGELFSRVSEYQSQSPFYYILVWFSVQLFGPTEFGVRLPSLICVLGTALLMLRLGRAYLSGSSLWLFAPATLIALPDILHVMTSARPYSLGLFCGVSSIVLALRLELDDRPQNRSLFLISAIACLYTHYMLAPISLSGFLFLWFTRKDRRRLVKGGFVLFTMSALPLIPQILYISGRRHSIGFAPAPSLLELIEQCFSAPILLTAIGSVLLANLMTGAMPTVLSYSISKPRLIFLLSWVFFPFFCILFVAFVTGASIILARFFVFRNVAHAVLILIFFSISCRTDRTARLATFFFLSGSILTSFAYSRVEDWRSAAAEIWGRGADADSETLFWPGLIESNSSSWLQDEYRLEYLRCPLIRYPIPGKVHVLPWSNGPSANQRYLEGLLARLPDSSRRIFFLARSPQDWFDDLRGMMRSRGFGYREFGNYRGNIAAEFVRTSPSELSTPAKLL